MPISIPLSQPDITQSEIDAVVEVLRGQTLSMGPKLDDFEEACAKVARRRHGIGVSSGSAGLHTALAAAEIGAADEVITTPFSSVASTNCILYLGAKPVFVDIDPQTLNMDPGQVEKAINPRTRAMVAVEALGHPGGMAELEQIALRHDLVMIEDCCESFGGRLGERPAGSFGKAGVFAFHQNNQVTTGEGGMIVTDDDDFATACRRLRNQGRERPGELVHHGLGFNYRLSEINAALGLAQVARLQEILDRRRMVAHDYIRRLMANPNLILPTLADDTHMSWCVFVVRLNDLFESGDRALVIDKLNAQQIGSSVYFPPIHLQEHVAQRSGCKSGDFPVCEYIASRTLALPFFGSMTGGQIERVCNTLEMILDGLLAREKKRF